MADQKSADQKLTIDQLRAFCARKGFIYPSSEIYGGMQAIYDYGHYGMLLRKNIEAVWWQQMLQEPNIKALDSAIFTHPRTWEASGHVEAFSDPLVECKTCNNRMRADHLLEKFDIDVDKCPINEINDEIQKLNVEGKLKCEKCGGKDLTEAKNFNLLVKTNLGSPTDDLATAEITYLRGETCQGIYLNYLNYVKNMRVKIPFGMAQIGKAFRNEIVARQFSFRTREFEQMEMQMFIHPSTMDAQYADWKERRMNWVINELGIPAEKLRFKDHVKLAHYASAAVDIEYDFATLGGFKEIEGIHARGDWDLSRHQEYSGQSMEYVDQESGERFIPHIMETSGGLSRYILVVLDNGYTVETLEDGSERTVLKIKPSLAPIKAAIFPLTKDETLQKIAGEIQSELQKTMMVEYDLSGSIGKRYRRQDEIGTPFCITVDFDSIDDGMVTIRDRDTLKQERVKVEDVKDTISKNL